MENDTEELRADLLIQSLLLPFPLLLFLFTWNGIIYLSMFVLPNCVYFTNPKNDSKHRALKPDV